MTTANTIHPFDHTPGADRLVGPVAMTGLLLLATLVALIAGFAGLLGIGVCVGLCAFFLYAIIIFKRPIAGLYTAVALSFVLIGIGRYVTGLQVGLGMDAILLFTYVALFFNRFRRRIDWTPAKKDITVLATIWFGYSLFQIVNPEARSFEAWFSGRGIGLYMFLLVPLTLLFIDTKEKLFGFLVIWGIFSLIATAKGIMQKTMGVDAWEQGWLNEGNFKTHVLFGKLRVFSFLSDAGQFGANQAYSGVVASLLVGAVRNWKMKLFFLVVALMAFYGMVISGTRGALSIPFTGFALFFLLRKNKTVLTLGVVLLVAIIYFFKFTTIGQGNADIRRMRTAFDPNDASLQVRLDNQRILKSYLSSRPFGGGIGHGGVKAQRFLPNAYLSQIPTDSWYVLIWVEQGIVGLVLHLFILFYILIKASYQIMFKIRDPMNKMVMAALASGMFGVMVASYGNAVLGQMPTNVLIYISMGLLLNSKQFENDNNDNNLNKVTTP
jgi:hypothetical protein